MTKGFRINDEGRPEGTSRTSGGVVHYTCNAPSQEVLSKNGIQAVGDKFGIDPREVLIIPERLFGKNLNVDTGEAENLLVRLGSQARK